MSKSTNFPEIIFCRKKRKLNKTKTKKNGIGFEMENVRNSIIFILRPSPKTLLEQYFVGRSEIDDMLRTPTSTTIDPQCHVRVGEKERNAEIEIQVIR